MQILDAICWLSLWQILHNDWCWTTLVFKEIYLVGKLNFNYNKLPEFKVCCGPAPCVFTERIYPPDELVGDGWLV